MILKRAISGLCAGLVLVLSGCSGGVAAAGAHASPVPVPEPQRSDVAARLGMLSVTDPQPMDGYSREKFRHWIIVQGKCDTREEILFRDGTDVIRDSECRAVSGRWVSPYDGVEITESARVDIDHMVPLANAWRSGANAWTDAAREKFANDVRFLLAVSATSNRSKGDQSPDQWKPPLRGYWCRYASAWIDAKFVYGLTITQQEAIHLGAMIGDCPHHPPTPLPSRVARGMV